MRNNVDFVIRSISDDAYILAVQIDIYITFWFIHEQHNLPPLQLLTRTFWMPFRQRPAAWR